MSGLGIAYIAYPSAVQPAAKPQRSNAVMQMMQRMYWRLSGGGRIWQELSITANRRPPAYRTRREESRERRSEDARETAGIGRGRGGGDRHRHAGLVAGVAGELARSTACRGHATRDRAGIGDAKVQRHQRLP